jgi:hypothetical protein
MLTKPAGASILISPGTFGFTNPDSMAAVMVPMVPCPHMGKQPLVSMKSTAKSFSGSWGG